MEGSSYLDDCLPSILSLTEGGLDPAACLIADAETLVNAQADVIGAESKANS
jgi:hypothetical protein